MPQYARGTDITFSVVFMDDAGDPMVPFDSTYPFCTILDPHGAIVATGVGAAVLPPGSWQFTWSCSAGSELSDGWTANWTMLDGTQQSSQKQSFGLFDQIEAQTEVDRNGGYLCMLGCSERIIWKSAAQQDSIGVTIKSPYATCATYVKADLTEVLADNYWNYYVDLPVAQQPGDYLVVWDTRETPVSRRDQTVQYLRIPYDNFWYVLPYLRGLIDKLNKVQVNALSYTDQEMYLYFERGLDWLNAVYPATYWRSNQIPSNLWTWWVLASGIYALNARQLLEIEVQHTYTGQSVSLDYNHADPLADIIGRWENLLWEKFIPQKLSLIRHLNGPGMVGVRPYRLSWENRVYRVGTSATPMSNWPGLISSLFPF